MKRRILLALTLAAIGPTAWSAELDAGSLLRGLARPAPATIGFKEIRFSSLLREPLAVTGELGYSGATNLERKVLAPYRETTRISGDSVRVEREGEQPRSFALRRAPELRGLLAGFTALLAGDLAALERSFDVQTSGTEGSWNLELTPRDANARRRLDRIVVSGRADTPRCFSMMNRDGGASVMLLGEAAGSDLTQPTLERLLTFCRAE